jgi:hypothetical protein
METSPILENSTVVSSYTFRHHPRPNGDHFPQLAMFSGGHPLLPVVAGSVVQNGRPVRLLAA